MAPKCRVPARTENLSCSPMRTNRWTAIACLVGAGGCAPPTEVAQGATANEWRAFEGTWSAAGTRHTLHMGPDHDASVFRLGGSLVLTGPQKMGVGYRAEAIGLSDTLVGVRGRSVWTDERGDEIYSELKGAKLTTGSTVEGTILGGTGRWAGVTGDYSFRWQFVVQREGDEVSGRAVEFKGRARIAAAIPALPRSP